MAVGSDPPDIVFGLRNGQLVEQFAMSKFYVKIRAVEIEHPEIVQAIHVEEIISHSDGAMAECLVKLSARGVGDQRNLRGIAEPRQPSGDVVCSRISFLSRSEPRGRKDGAESTEEKFTKETQNTQRPRIHGGILKNFKKKPLACLIQFPISEDAKMEQRALRKIFTAKTQRTRRNPERI